MTFISRTIKTLFSFGLLAAITLSANADQRPFDYYLMSLSWSPEFCATRPEDRQCGRGYGLVLHGVWPQYSKGYPSSCSHERISAQLVRQFPDLYPSEKLAFHEWQKHGTCSDLAPEAYLQLSQSLKQSFINPPELQNLTQPLRVTKAQLTQIILTANPKLNEETIALTCKDSGRFLQEIMVCFDKSGANATACGADVKKRSKKSCGQDSFLVRNIR
ncbi:MAG: ribonuclease [Methylococcaceae bacterium]|nr:ribonuclease [Methylococcaceae bacterium]